MTQVDTMTAMRSLASRTCPACGRSKGVKHTLCYRCYRSLPVEQREALYDPIGAGYEVAVDRALATLDVAEPHWPDDHAIADLARREIAARLNAQSIDHPATQGDS